MAVKRTKGGVNPIGLLESSDNHFMNHSNPLTQRRELLLLITLAGIQFSHVVDFMIMMPLGPQLRELFTLTDAQFGFIVSAYSLAAGFSGLFAATYIDRFGRKTLLLVLYALFGLSTIGCALSVSYSWLIVSRIAAGASGGVLAALSQTIVADVIPFERRGRAMGVVMTSFSVATVAGIPAGLFLATQFGWHSPFFVIGGLSIFLMFLGVSTLPRLDAHLEHSRGRAVLPLILQVLRERNHQRALLLSACIVFAGFTVVPYITLYMRANVGLAAEQIPYIYLVGGLATLFSMRWIGQATDRVGKAKTFKVMVVLAVFPLLITTLLPPVPLWVVLITSSCLFVCMSGRMVPGMAIVSSAARPEWRGTFMTINSAVQSASMGVAAFVGGHLIGRNARGELTHYWMAAGVGIIASIWAFLISSRVHLHKQAQNKTS